MGKINHIVFLILMLCAASIGHAQSYDFERPDAWFELPGRLDEISGLTLLGPDRLGAVQDEDGDLFILDIATGTVVERKSFRKDGDYEGLTAIGDTVFILRSDGHFYRIDDWQADEELDTETFKPDLPGSCDAEGLAHQPAYNRLLIACKESPGRNRKGRRAVFAFDLATEMLDPEPVYTILFDAVDAHLNRGGFEQRLRSFIRQAFDTSDFKPSALAVHPATGDVWVLSSVLKALAVLSADGELQDVHLLPDDRFPQPEGLTFLPNGDLFISSEARGRTAVLVRYLQR